MKRKSKLAKRVTELERAVKALETRPSIEYHYHYPVPTYTSPWHQPWICPNTTWSTTGGIIGTSTGLITHTQLACYSGTVSCATNIPNTLTTHVPLACYSGTVS